MRRACDLDLDLDLWVLLIFIGGVMSLVLHEYLELGMFVLCDFSVFDCIVLKFFFLTHQC